MKSSFGTRALPRVAVFLAALTVLAAVTYRMLRRDAELSRPRQSPLVCATDDTSKWSPLFRARMPDVVLTALDRTPTTLHALAGASLTAVVFCSSRCPCSDGYAGRLRALRETYERKGVSFVAVNSNAGESFEDLKSYAASRSYPLPVFRDQDAVAADAMRARVTPEAFVFTADWRLAYHGRIDDDKSGVLVRDPSLQRALDTLLSGRPLFEKEKTALGCAIER
ncbi:MAG: redoxin family protein [Ignavibacteria bacterium]|nr:redoxin family protein [Ignavibacteria bacterium]